MERVVKPFVRDFHYRRVCEIGASYGGATDLICTVPEVNLVVIDPCIDADLCEKFRDEPNIKVCQGLSLQVLPQLAGEFDCFLIDGDHNWYTVFNELETIHRRGLLKEGGAIFLHDVGWPYGRRDMYYQPQTIPQPFLRPYATAGIVYGKKRLSSSEGVNAEFFNAEEEGGQRNGVLTAVEDFIKQEPNKYSFFRFRDECGLGLLLKGDDAMPRTVVFKWRLICILVNLLPPAKSVLKHRFPALHRMLRMGVVGNGRA